MFSVGLQVLNLINLELYIKCLHFTFVFRNLSLRFAIENILCIMNSDGGVINL